MKNNYTFSNYQTTAPSFEYNSLTSSRISLALPVLSLQLKEDNSFISSLHYILYHYFFHSVLLIYCVKNDPDILNVLL